MPKSRLRKKKKDNRPEILLAERDPAEIESPAWLAPTMIGAFLVGLFWIVIFYVSQTLYPIPNIGANTSFLNYICVILHRLSTPVHRALPCALAPAHLP